MKPNGNLIISGSKAATIGANALAVSGGDAEEIDKITLFASLALSIEALSSANPATFDAFHFVPDQTIPLLPVWGIAALIALMLLWPT